MSIKISRSSFFLATYHFDVGYLMFLIKFKPFNNYVPTYCYKVEIIKHKVVIQSKLITIKFALSLN